MSAIFGMLRFDGADVSPQDMERMSNALTHRGPHGRRFVIDGRVGIGHCLMRVNREDQFEVQPVSDRDLTLSADLRLDNREELAATLGIDEERLAVLPDGALLLSAYRRWGIDCAEHLLGDFAFAIWDAGSRRLVLGRDHIGQRYVHYYRCRDFLVFATEIKALFCYPDVPRRLSELQIGRLLLRDHAPARGATPFEGIYGLTSATVMSIGLDGAAERRRYWQLGADPIHQGRNDAYYIEAYRRVLGEAVSCRIRRAIRSPGIVFSGGYDSAAIAGLAGPVVMQSGRKLIAAASVMPPDYRGTIRHARPWVEMCARDMAHLDVRYVTREGKNILTGLDSAFLKSDLPAGAYHFVGSELLSTLARAGAHVVLDGHGGDYTLHPRGDAVLAHLLATLQVRRFVSELRAYLRLSGRSLPTALRRDIAALLMPFWAKRLWQRVTRRAAPPWRDQPINDGFGERLFTEYGIGSDRAPTSIRSRVDMRGRIANTILRVMEVPSPGMAAMAASLGLELTRPFHDKRVVELALAVPQDLYVRNGRNRYLACVALQNVYPREFQTRGRMNDDEIPDFLHMMKSVEPQLLAEISEMEKSERLTRYVDFSKIRTLLAARRPDEHNSGWEQEMQLAAHGFTVARYLNWFWQSNR